MTIAFLFGVLVAQLQPQLPPPYVLLLAIPCLLLLRHRVLPLRGAGALVLGFCWATAHVYDLTANPLPAELEGENLTVEGEIVGLPERAGRRLRFILDPDTLIFQGKSREPPGLLRLSWYDSDVDLLPGERWRLTVRLKRPHGMANPGTFDYEAWLLQHRICATGYVRGDGAHLRLDGGTAPIQRLRYRLAGQLGEVIGQQPAISLLPALAIGVRQGMDNEQWRILNATGTSHLMAISGLHIGLVAGLVFFLSRSIWARCAFCVRRFQAPRAAALCALFAALTYAALAGFSIPTQRALIMVSVVMVALLLRRTPRPSKVLARALVAVLLLDPLAVLSVGFWLSFSAVAVLGYGMGARPGVRTLWWRWGRPQWLVAVGLAPLLLVYFQQLPLVAPLANVVAIPWVSLLVVPPTLLGTLLLPLFPVPAGWLIQLAATALAGIWWLLQWLADWPTLLAFPAPQWWTLFPATLAVLLLLGPRGWPGRWLGGFFLLPILLARPPSPLLGEVWLTLLDVGQGLAAVVRTEKHTLVFDTGPRYASGFDTGRAVIVPYLRSLGVERVDRLIISHGDNDHIGGARSLLEMIPVDSVLTSVPGKMTWVANQACQRGMQWRWDGVGFRILHPEGEDLSGNDASCVLRIDNGQGAILLPGDIEADAEQRLLHSAEPLQAGLLVAPHHGSNTSSTREFLARVSPRWAMFPVGYRNRYGFPRPQVVSRYNALGIEQLDSASSGAIDVRLGKEGAWRIMPFRQENPRYWRD